MKIPSWGNSVFVEKHRKSVGTDEHIKTVAKKEKQLELDHGTLRSI